VDIWVNNQSKAETETLMTKLKEMGQNRFIHYPNSFRWMHPDGVEIPVDFVRAEMVSALYFVSLPHCEHCEPVSSRR
jgi:hypothetical protein